MSRLMIRFNATKSVNDCNRTITARALQGQLGTAAVVTVFDQTIWSRWHAAGLRARRPIVCIPLKQRHRIHCLDWCQFHLQWNGLQWSRVAFSDESRFNLYFNDGRMRVYRRRGERYSDVTSKNMSITEEGQ